MARARKTTAFQQPEQLARRVAEAGIPHGHSTRVRVPNALVDRGTLRFCPVDELELLTPLPAGSVPCPNARGMDVYLDGKTRLRLFFKFVDVIGVIHCNGAITLKVEQIVPCGAAV